MTTYLAVVRFTMDDIPILVTDSKSEAINALQTINTNELADIQETLETDVSQWVCGAVYHFTDGMPTGVEHDVRLLQLEGDESC